MNGKPRQPPRDPDDDRKSHEPPWKYVPREPPPRQENPDVPPKRDKG
jgi:hypothetical protein